MTVNQKLLKNESLLSKKKEKKFLHQPTLRIYFKQRRIVEKQKKADQLSDPQ